MVEILIVTHGGLGSGLLNAVELITGKQPNIKTIGLYHGKDPSSFEHEVRQSLEQITQKDDVLVFVDFLGGTPSNVLIKCIRDINFPCIAGVNMSMLLEAVTTRDCVTGEEWVKNILEAGLDGILKLNDIVNSMHDSSDNDF